jgi:putative SOS response-associated peptidase YedK
MVRFSNANECVFYALGIWNDWIDPTSGEVFPTFTLLTDDPDEFVFENGHDRGLILLNPSDWNLWLSKKMQPAERIAFIRSQRISPHWKVEIERSLKNGWQKHSPTQREIARIEVFKGHEAS